MAIKFAPKAHTTAQVAEVDGTTVYGQSPAGVIAQLNGDQHASPTTIWVATALSADGFPTAMRPVTVSTTGSVG